MPAIEIDSENGPNVPEHCRCCLMSLGLGPRLQRILAHLIAHPEWEADASLEIIRFRILDRGVTPRVTYQTTAREKLGSG